MLSFLRHPVVQTFGGTVLLTSLIVTGGVVSLRKLGAFEDVELSSYDRFTRLKPSEPADPRITVIGINHDDILKRQEYPIEDDTLFETLQILEDHKPRVIGIDVFRNLPYGSTEGQKDLSRLLQQTDHIVSACLISSFSQPSVRPDPGAQSDLVGFTNYVQDPGGVVRRTTLSATPALSPQDVVNVCNDQQQLPSFSFLVSQLYLQAEAITATQTDRGTWKVGNVFFNALNARTGVYANIGKTQTGVGDSNYQIMLNYRGHSDIVQQLSLSDVLDRQFNPDLIQDRIVLIGYTAPIAHDSYITPYRLAPTANTSQQKIQGMPDVIIHAQGISQIISAVLDGRPLIQEWPGVIQGFWFLGWSIFAGILGVLVKRTGLFIVLLIISIAAVWGACFALFLSGVWAPVMPTMVALVVTGFSVSILNGALMGGYTQAMYELVRDQLQGKDSTSVDANLGHLSHLENLILRARDIREGNRKSSPSEVIVATEPVSDALTTVEVMLEKPQFDNPESQQLYEQIKAKALKDFQEENARVEADQTRQRLASQKNQLNNLLAKARAERLDPS